MSSEILKEEFEDEEEIYDSEEEDEVSEEEEDDTSNDPSIVTEDGKKKRGRKPKVKDVEEDDVVEKVQKKRGRKPKVKDVNEEEKKPKKRGRKPKEKIYSVKELQKSFFDEHKSETLIIHLPIKTSDINDNNNPKPSNNEKNDYLLFGDNIVNIPKNDFNNNEMLPTQLNFLEIENKNNNSDFFFDTDKNNVSDKLSVDINYDKVVDKVIDKVSETVDDDSKNNRVIKKNLKNILYEFINANNDKVWPESTNIHCWWCCHKFEGIPCALPEFYKKDKFYVNGCFCSFNCTTSYNFSKNDDAMWERYSLLNLMYKKMYKKNFVKINLAPPREALKIFGGYLSIEEFREYSIKNDKTFQVINPPLISIIPKIEENINISKNAKNNNQSINESILTKTQNSLKLKRNKPITNPNSTLQSFMDLKIM
jgi:hypothetical protein